MTTVTDLKKITITIPPRYLHCGSCGQKTWHEYDRQGVFGKIFVCQCCGKERTA